MTLDPALPDGELVRGAGNALIVSEKGDARLLEKLRREELIPLGSRIRTRLATEAATPEQLRDCLDFVLAACGNANLMTAPLKHTLCDHAAGNYRVLATLASVPEIAAQFKGGEGPLMIAYCDTPRMFEVMYPLLTMMAPAALPQIVGENSGFDLSAFPSTASVGRDSPDAE